MVGGDDDGAVRAEQRPGREQIHQYTAGVGRVEVLGRLVEQQDRRPPTRSARASSSRLRCPADTAAAPPTSTVASPSGSPSSQRPSPTRVSACAQLVVGGVAAGDQQVVAHGRGEQVGVLGEEARSAGVPGARPCQQHRGLARSRWARPTATPGPGAQRRVGGDGRAGGGCIVGGFGECEQAARSDAGPGQRDGGAGKRRRWPRMPTAATASGSRRWSGPTGWPTARCPR